MIFEKIVLHNMFSYYGEVSFDLAGGSTESNIVLISGRNGYGKTSFIRSLKLLFSGTEAPLVISITGREMPQKRFVTGDGNTWLGIMNRKAAKENQTSCHVQIEWIEPEPVGRVTAIRSWNLNGNNFLGDLEIRYKNICLKDSDDTKGFLNQRLPSAYIPFFFFDSEQIEKMADSIDDDAFKKNMEQLLDIAPIDLLRKELKKIASEWQRDSMEKKEQHALLVLQNRLKEEELAVATEEEKEQELEYDKEELEQTIQELENRLETLEDIRGSQDLNYLRSKRGKIKDERGKNVAEFTELIRKESPLLANPLLVNKTIRHLEQAAESKMGVAAEILENLKQSLVTGLLEEPPYPTPELENGQKKFLRTRLVRLIDAKIPDTDTGLFSLDTRTAEVLKEHFVEFKGMTYARQEVQRILKRIHKFTQDLSEIDFKMIEATGLSDEERERIESLKTEIRSKTEELGGKKKEIEQSQKNKNNALKKIQKIKSDIRNQEKTVALSKRARKKVELARELRQFFNTFKENLRKTRKDDVEKAFNQYVDILMPTHLLVDRIIVSDAFSMSYINKTGDRIGRSSLSSGMKQLIVTALLWALKTVSGKDVPIVIDTPFGRLDAEHQRGLLKNYYPAVGKQVILLPTDSELDEIKYQLIHPYVYKEYRLKNTDGESAVAEKLPMYPAT